MGLNGGWGPRDETTCFFSTAYRYPRSSGDAPRQAPCRLLPAPVPPHARDAEARVDAEAELRAELDRQVADDPSVEPDDVDYSDREVVLAAVSGRWGAIARAEAGDLKTTVLARMLRGEFPADA